MMARVNSSPSQKQQSMWLRKKLYTKKQLLTSNGQMNLFRLRRYLRSIWSQDGSRKNSKNDGRHVFNLFPVPVITRMISTPRTHRFIIFLHVSHMLELWNDEFINTQVYECSHDSNIAPAILIMDHLPFSSSSNCYGNVDPWRNRASGVHTDI